MKSLKDFISSQKSEPVVQEEVQQEPEFLELEDLDFVVEDATDTSGPGDPPAMMIMRRKQIRQFPGGQKVALYYIEKINKYVTIPYGNLGWSNILSVEETQLEENVIHHLKHIVDNHTAKSIKFKDGKSTKVDVQTAQAVLKVHGALNDENKKKVETMAGKSKHHFGKVVDFAWKHVTLK